MKEMSFKIFSRKEVVAYKPEKPAILISITEMGFVFPNVEQENYLGILQLEFSEYEFKGLSSAMFNEEHAVFILNFVKKHLADIQEIVVNCDMGVARSSAVAKALSEMITGTSEWMKNIDRTTTVYLPTDRVYFILMENKEILIGK